MSAFFDYPKSAAFGRVVPKTKIYEHAGANTALKDLFVREVDQIVWRFKLAPETTNLSATPAVAASTAVARALQHTGLGVVSVRTSATGVDIRVTVSAHTPTDVPLIGAFVGDVEHTATVVMALEPP